MNKIQMKAEILATLTALMNSGQPDSSLLNELKNIEDKHFLIEILLKELQNAKEQKILIINWLLVETIEINLLRSELWNAIKNNSFNDNVKIAAFNLLKLIGEKIEYDEVKDYFHQFNEVINIETQNLLNSALMNPEAQIDFMDFLNSISDNDKILLICSLEDDYDCDALANILIPVYLYYQNSEVGNTALKILGRSRSKLAYHALINSLKNANENQKNKINRAITELKMAGVIIDNAENYYKEILKDSKPYKTYLSFPDGHGNIAIIFSRINAKNEIQLLALVINLRYGILDCFGFNCIDKESFYKIVEKFYNYEESNEVNSGIAKYLIEQAKENSYINNELIPYEYICWESILLDIESEKPNFYIQKKELKTTDIEKLNLSKYVQNWFFDEITSNDFNIFIEKLSNEIVKNNFDIDLEQFISDNFNLIYTTSELTHKCIIFNIAAYLRMLKGDIEFATIFYSLGDNKEFLTNIIRKSIYEYYIGKRYILNSEKKSMNIFENKNNKKENNLELLQLDLIISNIESLWVKNA